MEIVSGVHAHPLEIQTFAKAPYTPRWCAVGCVVQKDNRFRSATTENSLRRTDAEKWRVVNSRTVEPHPPQAKRYRV